MTSTQQPGPMDDPAYLRQRARQCRRLAEGSSLHPDDPAYKALLDLADEFAARAASIEEARRTA